MNGKVAVVIIALAILEGCKSAENKTEQPSGAVAVISAMGGSARPATTSSTIPALEPGDRVVAKVNGRTITLHQLQRPLIESYGLNVLLNLVQLELAKQEATRAAVAVDASDITRERTLTLEKMFKDAPKDEYDLLLDQFLTQQRISRPEFDIVVETNAYLRKIAEPILKGKITDANLKEAFAALYGETIVVRHIEVSNLQEIADAKRLLAAGEPFEQVARKLSRNSETRALGGELPPFSRAMTGLSESFKEAAFALKVGEVSDPVQANGAYHLIKLIKRMPPKAAKFEDVKEIVRADLYDRWLQASIKELRGQLAQNAMQTMEIIEPVLRTQFEQRMGKRDAEVRDRAQIERELQRDRDRIRKQQDFNDQSTTRPSTLPTSISVIKSDPVPATAPTPPKASAEPPATRPGH